LKDKNSLVFHTKEWNALVSSQISRGPNGAQNWKLKIIMNI
jgi:hypothetical protein